VNSPLHELALIHYGLYDNVAKTFETKIGVGTRIWAFASVQPGALIGDNCTIGEGVHIGPKVIVGNGCKIQNGAQLFEGVTLEDDVFIGPHVVFTNVTNPRAFVNRKAEFEPTLVKRGASIGANVTIICGVTIGEYAMVGAGSVVTRDVRPHSLVVGNPAQTRQYVCKCGLPVLNPESFGAKESSWDKRVLDCSCRTCGEKYSYKDYKFIVGDQKEHDAQSTPAP
jgi:UDP-2-acetamido-3-amino-2,3-dideoxy-glucuronate N-acetyltransferase